MTDFEVENAKAIQEASKAVSQVASTAEKFGGFLAKFTKEPLEAGIGIFSDKLKYLRWERQLRLMNKAEELLSLMGRQQIDIPFPLKHAVPLIEAASLEENDDLQDMYAKLLVNACLDNGSPMFLRSYIDSIERFTPLMAKIFDNSYKHHASFSKYATNLGNRLPESTSSSMIFGDCDEDTELAWAELDRLGCLNLKQVGSNERAWAAKPTMYGLALYNACNCQIDGEKYAT